MLLLLVPLHTLPLFLDVLGWSTLLMRRARLRSLLWIAAIREAVNRLLPVGNIGGEVVGIRLLAAHGVDGTVAAASVIVELLLTIVAQYLFLVLGAVCLLMLSGAAAITTDILVTLGVSLPVIALLIALLRYGSVFQWLGRFVERIVGNKHSVPSFLASSADLDSEIRDLYGRRKRLVATIGWELLGLIVGTIETWLALRWFGHPVGFAASVALESVAQAVRNFIFLVPAGLGVQEAGLIGVGYLLGVGADLALALSLAKRMREIVFGVPALICWYWSEGRRAMANVRARGRH